MGRALGFPKESLKEQSTHNVLKEVRALEYRMEYIKGAFRKNQDKWTTASLAGQEKKLTALKKKFEAISTTIESSISQSGDSTVLGIVHKGIQDNIAELTAALNSIAKLNSQQADETPNVIQERLQKMTVHTPAKYAMIHAKTGEGANPPEKGNDGQDTQSKAIKRTPPATGSTKRPVRQPLSQTGQIAPTPPSRQVIQTLPTASSGSGGQQKQGGSGSKNRVSSTGGEASTLEDGKWSESAWKQSAETLKVRWKTTKGFVIIYSRLEVTFSPRPTSTTQHEYVPIEVNGLAIAAGAFSSPFSKTVAAQVAQTNAKRSKTEVWLVETYSDSKLVKAEYMKKASMMALYAYLSNGGMGVTTAKHLGC